MSDTTIAILILPVLVALTVALECSRMGCTKLSRHLRAARERSGGTSAPENQAGPDYVASVADRCRVSE